MKYVLSEVQKAAKAAYQRAWKKAHKEEVAAYQKAWVQTHQAEISAYRQSHKAEMAASDKAYRLAHYDAVLDRGSRRLARKRSVTIENVSRAVVYERDAGRCHICGRKVNPNRWHLEHLVPLARGGEHSYQNVAVSHPTCNLRKYTKAGAQLRLL